MAPEHAVMAARQPVKNVWQAGPEATSGTNFAVDSRLAPKIKSMERLRELETFKLEANEMVQTAQRQASRDYLNSSSSGLLRSKIRKEITVNTAGNAGSEKGDKMTKNRHRWSSAPWATERKIAGIGGGLQSTFNTANKNIHEQDGDATQPNIARERVQFDVRAINDLSNLNNSASANVTTYERRTHPETLDSSVTPSKASQTENRPVPGLPQQHHLKNRPQHTQLIPMFKHKRSKVGAVLDTHEGGRPLCKSKSQPILHDMPQDIINNVGYMRSTQAANGKAVAGNGDADNKARDDNRDVDDDDVIDDADDDVSDDIEEAMKTAWILKWLEEVAAEGTERPESPFIDEESPQTDTAIHIVYTGD